MEERGHDFGESALARLAEATIIWTLNVILSVRLAVEQRESVTPILGERHRTPQDVLGSGESSGRLLGQTGQIRVRARSFESLLAGRWAVGWFEGGQLSHQSNE